MDKSIIAFKGRLSFLQYMPKSGGIKHLYLLFPTLATSTIGICTLMLIIHTHIYNYVYKVYIYTHVYVNSEHSQPHFHAYVSLHMIRVITVCMQCMMCIVTTCKQCTCM